MSTSPEYKERPLKPIRYGIFNTNFTPEVLLDIAKIYEKTTKDCPFTEMDVLGIRIHVPAQLQKHGLAEMRLGSKLSSHSKLEARYEWTRVGRKVVVFKFYPQIENTASTEKKLKGEQMENDFNREVNKYLANRGMAVLPKSSF